MTGVDRIYQESSESLAMLTDISLMSASQSIFSKALLLSAASYFELRICEIILDHIKNKSNDFELINNFSKNIIARKYHTWFNWDSRNANTFFGLFGEDFKLFITKQLDDSLKESISEFIKIGNERNLLVHQDFSTYPFLKTLDEVYESYNKALSFLFFFEKTLNEYKN